MDSGNKRGTAGTSEGADKSQVNGDLTNRNYLVGEAGRVQVGSGVN